MDKIIERNIKLIKLLYSYDEFVSVGILAKYMGLSTKTLKIELERIGDYLSINNFGFLIKKHESTYYLERKSVHFLDRLVLDINKSSTYFFVTSHLFYNKTGLRDKFNRKYYSVSYFYKSKNKYEKILSKYGLSLSSVPTQLIGDEGIIRFYFYSFYWKNYGKVEWPFSHIKKEKSIEIVQRIEDSIQISFTKIEQLKLAYWIAIIMYRTWDQHFISSGFIAENLINIEWKKDSDWFKFLFPNKKKIDCKILKKEVTFLMSMVLLIVDTKNFRRLVNEKKVIYKDGCILDFAIKYCEIANKNFRFKGDMGCQTNLYTIYRLLYNWFILNGSFDQSIIYDKNEESISLLFNDAYQKFISELSSTTVAWWQNYKEQTDIWEELRQIILNSVELDSYQPTYKVYLYLSKGILEETIIMEHLNKLPYNLTFEKEMNSSVDLIITDIYLTEEEATTRCFFWNDTSIEKNSAYLQYYIENQASNFDHKD
ncbi:MAG: helix-turn-helix domain-containing protein [Carnobacterium maltaromaticum]